MDYKRILTIQDISCVGQCSLTVALPILSACGLETAVLPSAILSTHTAGFTGYTFRDLTDDMPAIEAHWVKEGIRFASVYTGYLGSAVQIAYVKSIAKNCLTEGGSLIVDPAMADNGKLYPAFDEAFAAEMAGLCAEADVILPNITEACFLTKTPFKADFSKEELCELIGKLKDLGAKEVVLTGASVNPEKTGVAVTTADGIRFYEHEKLATGCHGTGDVYSSAFTGAYMAGKSLYDAAKLAADFTLACMKNTAGDADHWYGVKFEPLLRDLGAAL